jgi:hypothetical protein
MRRILQSHVEEMQGDDDRKRVEREIKRFDASI